ncbi:MAG: family 16 glycosylhydrolase [Bacteroidota bacterium]|jgi:beta-glucanase (GH16 family)|nr:family 16 glycosylhydrolase [Flammeovirgaceae bacterium]MCZ8071636.1 family 16 glycosylhydrolase [Cytophagales bacterium]
MRLAAIAFVSLLVCQTDSIGQSAPPDGYTLVWSDEFSGTGSLNSNLWFHQTQLPAGGSWFNGELQHYTNRLVNSSIGNGLLKITAKRENFTDQGQTKQFTSARLNSKFAFTYGRVDVRAKLPSGAGTWPAIWMLGQNIIEPGGFFSNQFGTIGWPACGEIDIMEHWGNNPNVIHGSIHTPSSFGSTINTQTRRLSLVSSTFYIYSIVWDENKIDFLIDDVVFYSYNPPVKNASTWPFNKPQYLLLNIAMGGVGGPVDPTFTESSMDIDYVRIYQKGISPPNNTQTITFPSIPDKLISSPPFQLAASASSNLPVQYSSASDKIIITGNTVSIVSAGRVAIIASQPGNGTVSAAPEVSQSFCINPVQPLVATSGINTGQVTLTSNATSGNQWFLNGVVLPGATSASLSVATSGVYKVRVMADDCQSEFSDEIPILITGNLGMDQDDLTVFPNPVDNIIQIFGMREDITNAMITDLFGHQSTIHLAKQGNKYVASLEHLPAGLYVLRLRVNGSLHATRILKK